MNPVVTQHVFTIRAELASPIAVGPMPRGERRFVPITGGRVQGPALSGEILPLGGDSQLVLSDTLTEVSAHYFVRSEDGIGISVFNRGLRRASPDVARRLSSGAPTAATDYYFRTAPRFEAPPGSAYAWLNESLFIATAEREPHTAIIHVYRVM